MRFVLKNVSKVKFLMFVLLLFLVGAYNTVFSYSTQLGLDALVAGDNKGLITTIIYLVVGAILYTVFLYYMQKVMEEICNELSNKLSAIYMREILYKDTYSGLDEGAILNAFQNDVDNLSNFIKTVFYPLVVTVSSLIIGLIYSFKESSTITLIFIVLSIGLAVLNVSYSKKYEAGFGGYMQADDEYRKFVDSTYRYLPIVRNLNLTKLLSKKQKEKLNDKKVNHVGFVRDYSNVMAITEGGILVIEILVLMIGLWMVSKEYLGLGAMIGVWNTGLGSILYPITSLPSFVSQLARYKTSQERLGDLTGIETVNKKPKYNLKSLSFKDVSFSYDDDNVVFDNYNLELTEPGFHYIIGKSGSGKSTLIKLLLGIHKPTSGRIVTDDGSDLHEFSVFSYVPQIPSFFNMSIRDNLTLGSNVSDEKIKDLCLELGIWDIIDRLPNGLDTQYSKDIDFSTGQQKALAVVRAVLSGNKDIILDEPFAGVDLPMQERIMNYLSKIKDDRFIFIVSHTYDFMDQATSVIDLDKEA